MPLSLTLNNRKAFTYLREVLVEEAGSARVLGIAAKWWLFQIIFYNVISGTIIDIYKIPLAAHDTLRT